MDRTWKFSGSKRVLRRFQTGEPFGVDNSILYTLYFIVIYSHNLKYIVVISFMFHVSFFIFASGRGVVTPPSQPSHMSYVHGVLSYYIYFYSISTLAILSILFVLLIRHNLSNRIILIIILFYSKFYLYDCAHYLQLLINIVIL